MSDEASKVIAQNKGLIFKQLYKFGLAHDQEAESIGYEALYNAAKTFDSSLGYKLSTYATVCIYNALGSYVRTLNRQRQLDVVSYHALQRVSEDGAVELLDKLACDQDTEGDYLHAELCVAVANVFAEQYEAISNEKHKLILNAWKESHFEATTIEIAKVVGVSQSYVSQVLNKFKHSMKQRMEVYFD